MAREVLRVYVISENDGAAQEISGRAAQLLARQLEVKRYGGCLVALQQWIALTFHV